MTDIEKRFADPMVEAEAKMMTAHVISMTSMQVVNVTSLTVAAMCAQLSECKTIDELSEFIKKMREVAYPSIKSDADA